MENQNRKGRPPKQEKVLRRNHFSVWVTKDEKAQINQLVEKSGLSASQFFLTLALDVPIRRPQRKTLPTHTAETIRMLEQLSGVLSLAVLKTKDQHMQSQNWLESSQSIRHLARLISLWVFEDFQIRTVHQTLTDISDWMKGLYAYLDTMLQAGESKVQILERTSVLYQSAVKLLDTYSRYYLPENPPGLMPVWDHPVRDRGNNVHELIEQTLDQIANRKRR